MTDPRHQLQDAIVKSDVKVVDQVLTSYPGDWGPPIERGTTPYGGLLLAIRIDCKEECIQRLLRDPRSCPTDPRRLDQYTLYDRVDLVQLVLPQVSQDQLDSWLGELCYSTRLDRSPKTRQMIALGVRTGARLTEIKCSGFRCFSDRYPEIYWATLQAGPPVWMTAPTGPSPPDYSDPIVIRAPFPTALYQQTRARIDAVLTMVVGRDLAGYLWQAV